MKKKINLKSGIFSVILIFLFLGIATAYFFIFQSVNKSSGNETAGVAALTDETMPAIDELELKKDLLRFLGVYFNQKFNSEADRQAFAAEEYKRFLRHTAATGQEQDLLARFISDLGKILDNDKNNNFSDKTADQDLLKIKKELSN